MIFVPLLVSFLIAYVVGKFFGIGLGILTFILTVIATYIAYFWIELAFGFRWQELWTEEGRTEWRIRRRRAQAEKRKISEKAETIVRFLGDGFKYEDEKIRIQRIRNFEIQIIEGGKWTTVFIPGGLSIGNHKEKYYERESGGQYVEKTRTSSHIEPINSYIPGEWEFHLDNLFIQAKQEQSRKAEFEEKQRMIEEKKKFGL